MNMADHLPAYPGPKLPDAFPPWADLKGAWHLFREGPATFERMMAAHMENTRLACRQPGEYLLLEDATKMDYGGQLTPEDLEDLGEGGGRVFELRSSLAVRVEAWTPEQRPEGRLTGLFDQQCRKLRSAPSNKTRPKGPSRASKTPTWAVVLKSAGGPPSGSQWIYVAERESDSCGALKACQQQGVDFVIEASQDLGFKAEAESLRQALALAPVLGQSAVEVRSRGGQPARTATVELRSRPIAAGGPPTLEGAGVVEVREIHAPEGVKEPLHWILLTSLPCATLLEGQRVVGRFTARWFIAEYHKAMRSAAISRQNQMEPEESLASLTAVLALMALHLLETKLLAQNRPETFEAAANFGRLPLVMLKSQLGLPKGGWTNVNVLKATARLGGFMARQGDGLPGWETIWKGWRDLMWMYEGARLRMSAEAGNELADEDL